MSFLTLGTLVISEYLWSPKCTSGPHAPAAPSAWDALLPCAPDCSAYWSRTDLPGLAQKLPSFLMSSLILQARLKNTHRKPFICTLHGSLKKFRTSAHRNAKSPLYSSQVVLKPTGDNDKEDSCSLLSAYYGLGTMLSTVHTSFSHLFN